MTIGLFFDSGSNLWFVLFRLEAISGSDLDLCPYSNHCESIMAPLYVSQFMFKSLVFEAIYALIGTYSLIIYV